MYVCIIGAKLKCCLNYEVDQYVESLKRLPSREIVLYTKDNEYYFFKADILAHTITYSTDKHLLANDVTISARRAFEIISMNREGLKPDALTEDGTPVEVKSNDLLDQNNIERFDRTKKKKKRKDGGNKRRDDKKPEQEKTEAQHKEQPKAQTNSEQRQHNSNSNNRRDRRNRGGHKGGDHKEKSN